MFFSTVMRGNSAYDWKMTPTPRSRAGRSVTSLPWSMMLPESGRSSPAMMRSIVVLPLPEAPSRTSASPTPTSKETSSSTRAFLKLLLRPRTLAATSTDADSSGACRASPRCAAPLSPAGCASRLSSVLSVTCFGVILSVSVSLGFEPVAREKEREEDQEREEGQHDCDGVGGLDLPLVELGEDVERRGLRASGEVAGD